MSDTYFEVLGIVVHQRMETGLKKKFLNLELVCYTKAVSYTHLDVYKRQPPHRVIPVYLYR